MSTRHTAAEEALLSDLTPQGSSGAASKRFRKRLAADGFTVDEGFRLKPGYIYTVVRAISARINQNYDGWPSEELKKAYKTFIGKPCFVNHENHDPTKARGVVVASRYVENGADRYIEVVQEIDAQRFPKLAHEIKTGGLDSVSMGAEAGFTICSYCHNKATDLHDMCDHVRNHKGKTLTRFDRRTGKKEDVLVFESCHKISFFELSYVFEPADETAVASKVVVAGLDKTAGECPPGVDCSVKGLQTVEQITKDSPNNPVNQVSYSPDNIGQAGGSSGVGAGGALGYGDAKEMAHTKGLYEDLMKTFPGADIGTFRVDNFHEHDHGAMDFMTTDDDQAAAVREKAFASGAPYVLWKQQQWNSDGSVSGMENRGNPTQNHFDHVHIAPIPVPAAPEPSVSTTKAPAPTQRAAGKYTKDDFAIADGKKPWEREAPKTDPAEEESADLKEIEAMIRRADLEVIAKRKVRSAALKKVARNRAIKLAFGEIEAPAMVDTLRQEGTAPEDDNNDFERYVDPPQELSDPDLSAASRIDRQQELQESGDPAAQGIPGAAEGGVPPQQPQQQFITLQVPVPAAQDAGVPMAATPAAAAPQAPPMAPPQQPQQVMASTLDYFERYYGRRIANWLDAIEARRELTPEEKADYRRQTASLSTLENGRELSTTNRNPTKGTANMARTNIASRTKVATAGRRQHFAEGPLVDGGDRSRNNQGEQEEAFISQTPPEVSGEFPGDDAHNISNTEHNLVARVQRGRDQLLRDASQLASIRQRRAFDEAGGPTATVVDPKVQTGPEGEALTGDDFVSANPNDGVTPTNPKDASLRAFQAFDGWLAQKTGKSSRRHTEATIKKAAAQFSREAGISPQALFPALGIVLREARKSEKKANSKGAAMRKRSNESLEVAAPDARIDVESPVKNVSDAKAQASQFDVHDFGNNAGDNVAKPDLSTDQNWAPGEASKTSARVKTAGGLLAMRCAEGMIEAGLEPNSRNRKYQLAAEFENMNRNLIQDRVALLERFAAVRRSDLQRVASGSSRGAARSPIPAGLGGGTRTASTGQRLAAHDPRNDSSLFI